MSWKSYRDESRVNWGTKRDDNLNLEQIQVGCLLRIADASEAMAKEHNRLLASEKYQREKANWLQQELETERRRSAALRGHIKRLKKKDSDHE